jgi:ring-1,2-phenylacetyl-CoA epoxidase subunit PaaE
MPAQGKFSPEIDIDQKKDYFLWAGGSGITPLLSIAKSIVEAEPKSRVMLYYVNRTEESILFAEELKKLEQRYRDQIYIQHCLSQPKTEKKGGFLGFFAKTVSNWQGDAGRINAEKISRWVERQRSEDGRIAEHYLCGPEGMMRTISDTLRLRGVETANIHQEYFSDSSSDAQAAAASSAGSNIKVTLNKKTFEVELQPNETILKALMRIKANPPFSCTSGACSTCMAKVMSGKATMSRCLALDESEVQAGYILTCTATPDAAGGELHVNFDV